MPAASCPAPTTTTRVSRASSPNSSRAMVDRRLGEAGGAPRDRGLGANTSSRREGALKDLGQLGPRGVFFLCEFERATKLSEDLELPGDDGLEARGDAEEVGRDAAIEVDREACP